MRVLDGVPRYSHAVSLLDLGLCVLTPIPVPCESRSSVAEHLPTPFVI